MPFYKRKMLWFALVVSVIVVGGSIVYVRGENNNKGSVDNSLVFKRADTALSILKESGNKDSNSNGIPDWKEALSGVDVTAPSSASDSSVDMSDFTPTIEGPFSQAFEKNLFENIASSDSVDSLTSDSFANSSLTQDPRFADFITPKSYAANDLNISNDTSSTTVMAYVVNTALTLREYGKEYPQNVEDILSNAMKSDPIDPTDLAPLQQSLDEYTNMTKSFLRISVPKNMSDINLLLVNSISGIALSISNMQHLADDPIRGALGMQQYQNYSQALATVLSNMSDFVDKYQQN